MNIIKKIYFGFVVIALFFSFSFNTVFAYPSGRLQNPLKDEFTSIPDFLAALLDVVVTIAIPIIVIMIIYSGFLFIKAQGKPEDIVTARKAITWTLIGAAVILGASLLSYAISGTVDEIRRDIAQPTYTLDIT